MTDRIWMQMNITSYMNGLKVIQLPKSPHPTQQQSHWSSCRVRHDHVTSPLLRSHTVCLVHAHAYNLVHAESIPACLPSIDIFINSEPIHSAIVFVNQQGIFKFSVASGRLRQQQQLQQQQRGRRGHILLRRSNRGTITAF